MAAVVSMLLVPPDADYLSYADWHTIACLFSMLAVIEAFRRTGAFERAARFIVALFADKQLLTCSAIIGMTAVLSMVATNDVALLMMLPLSAAVLFRARWDRLVAPVFVLQGLAANLCGMIVPFGNPQNLYLYSCYQLHLGDFLQAMVLPFSVSCLFIAVCTVIAVRLCRRSGRKGDGARPEGEPSRDASGLLADSGRIDARSAGSRSPSPDAARNRPRASAGPDASPVPFSPWRMVAYSGLFALVVLGVFRIVPSTAMVVAVVAVLAALDRAALLRVDYPLLVTFLCFFVFAGNMARIPAVVDGLAHLMSESGLLASALLSQIISNVPAAVLLSHFTDAWQPLLVGVNIGGAGTPVGSLASLIVLQCFLTVRRGFPARSSRAAALSVPRFFGWFFALNLSALGLLLLVCLL